MSDSFATASAVVPDGRDGSARTWHADVDPDWSISGRPNGGYLMALAARAALAHLAADRADEGGESDDGVVPLATTGAFAAPSPFGPATVTTDVVRRGRTVSLVRARVASGGTTSLEVLVTAGRPGDGPPTVPGPPPPDVPPREACIRLPRTAPGGMDVPILAVLDQRLDPATLGFGLGKPSGAGELRGWLATVDGTDVDPVGLVMAVDCYPPAVFELPQVEPSWVPTLQLSAFVRAVPAPGPLRVRTVARSVGGGMVDETTDVWDSTGRLVAVGHQLAMVRLRG